jgi:hypothetical protein
MASFNVSAAGTGIRAVTGRGQIIGVVDQIERLELI